MQSDNSLLHVLHQKRMMHGGKGRHKESKYVFLVLKSPLNEQRSNQLRESSVLHETRHSIGIWLVLNGPGAVRQLSGVWS